MRPDPVPAAASGPASAPRSLCTQVGSLRLTLEMTLRGDRFTQRVKASLEGGADVVLAESLEDGSESPWPCSPPLQQVDRCILGNGREGLVAIGLAGVGHWSLAVEADERGVSWDAACRTPRAAEFLGSTYRMLEPSEWCEIDGGLWRSLPGAAAAPGTSPAGVLVRADRGATSWDAGRGLLVIQATELGSRLPATARWNYRCSPHAGPGR